MSYLVAVCLSGLVAIAWTATKRSQALSQQMSAPWLQDHARRSAVVEFHDVCWDFPIDKVRNEEATP